MVEIGAVIRAKVTRVEPYGVYLDYKGQCICVLVPDVSWRDTRPLNERIHVGEEYDVRVLRFNYRDRIIVGSIRLLHPEENPYRQLARLEPDTILPARITHASGEDVILELPNGALGIMPIHELPPGWQRGDRVEVVISSVEVDEGRLWLRPASQEVKNANGLVSPPSAAVKS